MSRSLDFGQALKYPFRADNWQNTLLWPGLIILVFLIVMYILNTVLSIVFMPAFGTVSPGYVPPEYLIIQLGMQSIVQLGFLPFLMGYSWQLVHHLRTNGYDSAAPDWQPEKLAGFWLDGLKLTIWSYVFSLPFLILTVYLMTRQDIAMLYLASFLYVVIMFPLAPFVWGALVQSSETRGFLDLVNIPRLLRAGTQCYAKALLANLVVYICAIISVPLMVLGCCCTLGLGYALTVAWLTFFMIHLFTQAFDAYREAPIEKKGYKRP